MSKINKLTYFWGQESNLQDWWLSEFIKHNIDPDAKIISHNENPDVLITSCFGNINVIKNINSKCKIFFYGENLDRFPPYNNIELLKENFDIIMGFKNNDIENKMLRFPLWLMYYPFYNYTDENNILKYIQESYNANINNPEKENIGSLIARHDNGGSRTKLYNELSKYVKVLCPSSFIHNTEYIGEGNLNKFNFIKKTTYNVCPENSEFEGYHTEKIFHALEAGCIPIYWAIDKPEKNIINENCYCFVNVKNDDDIKEKIKDVVENKNKYIQVNNLFTDQAKYVVNSFYENLKIQIQTKLDLIEKQKIYGISYASRHHIDRYQPITNQGNNCGLFNDFKCYREEDIENSFKEKYSEVWNDSTRGGGWWIWKAKIIYEKLKMINNNDILVYLDGGCSINITQQSTNRFNDYIKMINDSPFGLLRFELTHLEHKYTNKHTINYFSKKFNVDMEKHININQMVGGIILMKKTDFSIKFFEKILEILDDDPFLFNDKYSINEQHRHDQSIMSLLCKVMPGSIIIPDETYFGEGFNNSDALKYPFLATRLRS